MYEMSSLVQVKVVCCKDIFESRYGRKSTKYISSFKWKNTFLLLLVCTQIMIFIFSVINSKRVGHLALWVRRGRVYRVLVGKPEGRRLLGRPRSRWVDNIRMDLQEVGCGYMDWIGLAKDRDSWRRLVSAVMNLRGSVKWGEFLDWLQTS